MTYIYPVVGAQYEPNNTCTFTVWAPLKKGIEVVLDNTSIAHSLKKDERGYWTITLKNIKPGTHYYYRIDGEKKLPDPASRHQPKGVHGPSAIVDRSFSWTDSEWKGIALNKMIIYELHVGTFTPEGTFDGVISRLLYLKQLGINTIEIMPVAQFPGTRNWGYDGVFPFAVQNSYGGPYKLKQLVNEAHKHGIAVILDVVYNHLGPEGNYFNEYGPYFTDKYKTNWGAAINYDDAYCDGVRYFYWQNALMWLNEFHVDGLRMDAVHAIWDYSASHFILELSDRVASLEEQTGRKKVLIAETDLNTPRYIDSPTKGGYGMDGQWIDEFHHALHAMTTGETSGYYEDFGELSHVIKALRDSYVYTGQYSIHRKKLFGVPVQNPYRQFIAFAQNHDQIGNRMLGDRLSTQISFECLKAVAALLLLSPHVPMLFMGEEYGEKNPFQYFISHTDKELVDMVRKGRKEEFSYFKWSGEIPDPQSEDTFTQCNLSWAYERDEVAKRLLSCYQFLISLRKERPAMQYMERDCIHVFETSNKIIAFERKSESDHLLVILNFNKQKETFTLPAHGKVKILFDSSDKQWCGPGTITPERADPGESVQINAHSAVIFDF